MRACAGTTCTDGPHGCGLHRRAHRARRAPRHVQSQHPAGKPVVVSPWPHGPPLPTPTAPTASHHSPELMGRPAPHPTPSPAPSGIIPTEWTPPESLSTHTSPFPGLLHSRHCSTVVLRIRHADVVGYGSASSKHSTRVSGLGGATRLRPRGRRAQLTTTAVLADTTGAFAHHTPYAPLPSPECVVLSSAPPVPRQLGRLRIVVKSLVQPGTSY